MLRRRLVVDGNQDRDVLVHAGPGAGKTLGALISFNCLKKEGLIDAFIVFCHRASILTQWRNSALRLGLSLMDLESSLNQSASFNKADGWVVTYQAASRNQKFLQQNLDSLSPVRLLAIADEAHHLGVDPSEPEASVWGATFSDLTLGSRLRIGLTGTPFRADNLAFCSARRIWVKDEEGRFVQQISPDLSVEPRELIASGDVRPLEFHFQDGSVEHFSKGISIEKHSSISTEQRECWRARNLRRVIRLSDPSGIASHILLRASQKLEQVRLQQSNAAGLVIARDICHAKAIAQFLREDGNNVELVHSQDAASTDRLAKFQSSQADWLVSVDMCSEGFDAARIRVISYLTTVVTETRFLQSITRAIRINSTTCALEPLPRFPSFVFAPADPLLMRYARSWSINKPYLIKNPDPTQSFACPQERRQGPNLPDEAMNDKAREVITFAAPELPSFLSG